MASRAAELNLCDAEEATMWLVSFAAKARAKGWVDAEDDKKITDNFISACGLGALKTVVSIVAPSEIDSMNFMDIKKKIEEYLRPKKKLVIAERTKFYSTRQGADIGITQFVAQLRDAARHCEFEKLKDAQVDPQEEMIKIALLAGLANSEVQQRVLEKLQSEEMTLDQIVTCIQQIEQVHMFVGRYKEVANSEIHAVAQSRNRERPPLICYNCQGQGHMARNCTNKCYKCSKGELCNRHKKNAKKEYRKQAHFMKSEDISDGDDGGADYKNVFSMEIKIDGSKAIRVGVQLGQIYKTVAMQEDSGSDSTIISDTIWTEIGKPQLAKYSGKQLSMYDNSKLKIMGVLNTVILYKDKYLPVAIKVVKSTKAFGLLGRDVLMRMDELVNALELKEEPLPAIKDLKVTIGVKSDAVPVFCKTREPPIPLQAAVSAEIDEMLKHGVISEVMGGSRWASPVVVIPKKNGKIRLCCDYKVAVNKALNDDVCNAPSIEAISAKLDGAKFFAKFDLKSAYWQLELDEASKEITTINTTKGLYRFNRLPYGLKCSSAIFQRAMEQITAGLKGICVAHDDVLLFAPTKNKLNVLRQALMKRLTERGVALNWDKSTVCAESVVFLGHHISAQGLKPDPRLVEVVKAVEKPKTLNELEKFVGLVNFYGNKISHFADKCEPLNRLRKKGVPFSWGKEQNAAFNQLKEDLASDAVVQPYSLTKELTVACDASENALAAVLSQEGAPVMYLSRALTPAEKNYANIEREALSIVWAVKRAEKLLTGRKFCILTDHRPLEFIFGEHKALPKATSARLQRWAIALMAHNYEISYIPGKEIPNVDALSRLPVEKSAYGKPEVDCEELELGVHWNAEQHNVSWMTLAGETRIDTLLQGVMKRVQQNRWTNVAAAEVPFKKNREALTVENNVMLLGTRPVIPQVLRKQLISSAHEGHFGMSTTKLRLRQNVWWPGMDRDVEGYIRNCSACARKSKSNTERITHKWQEEETPFSRVHLDWAYVKNVGEILILVDAMSGWPEAVLCKDRSSETVLRVLRTLFARFGVPRVVVTDNAKEFVSTEVVEWLNHIGAEKLQTPEYHPRSNGLVERMVQTVKRSMSIWHPSAGTFHDYLQKVLLTYRSSRLAGERKATPAELMFGRSLRHPLIAFDGGESLIYRRNSKGPVEQARFLVQNSRRTVFLEKNDGNVVLAHIDQVKRDPVSDEGQVDQSDEGQIGQDDEGQVDQHQGGLADKVVVPEERRYPLRMRRPPKRWGYE